MKTPGLALDIRARRRFWDVIKVLARHRIVEPRDYHPDVFCLVHFRQAEALGFAREVVGRTHLSFRLTAKGRAALAGAYAKE